MKKIKSKVAKSPSVIRFSPSASKKALPSIFAVCDDLDCDGGICDVVIPQCTGDDFGQEVVKIFVAKSEAADFASVIDLATEATWDTKLGYDCTGANKNDRVVAIGDLYDGVIPEAERETQAAPYGVIEEVQRTRTLNFNIKRWDTALIDDINQIKCRASVKFWYLTDTGWLFGGVTGFENASIMWGDVEHNGPGGGKVKSTNVVTWKKLDLTVPVYAPFLKSKVNT